MKSSPTGPSNFWAAPSAAKNPVHPNDHVNRGQSSNDVIPTALHVGIMEVIDNETLPALGAIARLLGEKGRTVPPHLEDRPHPLAGRDADSARPRVFRLRTPSGARHRAGARGPGRHAWNCALGGTAVGTGINTHPEFGARAIKEISERTGIPFVEAVNRFEAQANQDSMVFMSGALRTVMTSLMKIANDIRWLGSGPRCGIGELRIPSLQPGSSIMPGKVNPVIPEVVIQAAAQVSGNDVAINIGGQWGVLELNTMLPMMGYNLLQSARLTGDRGAGRSPN